MPQCELCGGTSFRTVAKHRIANVIKCEKCGLVQLDKIPDKIENRDDYGRLDIEGYSRYLENFRRRQYKNDIELLKKWVQPDQPLLDIGCALGWFVDEAQKAGFTAEGVEPSATLVSWVADHTPHIKVTLGEFSKEIFGNRKFKVVTLWSVLEHMLHPMEQLIDISSILEEDGIVAIRVPNYNSVISFLSILAYKLSFGKMDGPFRSLYQLDFEYKHFYHFTPRTITMLLNNTGFEVLEIRKENSIDPGRLSKRATIKKDEIDAFFRNPIVSIGTRVALLLAGLLGLEDEMVVVARKRRHCEKGTEKREG